MCGLPALACGLAVPLLRRSPHPATRPEPGATAAACGLVVAGLPAHPAVGVDPLPALRDVAHAGRAMAEEELQKLEAIAEPWRPYRSAGCRLMWWTLNNEPA